MLRRGPLSVAAFGRVLRTLGGKNIGKCRLRAHQHPLSPPLPNRRQCKTSKARRVLGDVLRERAEDGLRPTSILDFGPELGNHCKVLPVYAILCASILDFRLILENRCRVFPGNAFQRASILDFMPRLANRCKVFSGNSPKAASILDFMPRLGNRCRFYPETPSSVHRFVISEPDLRITAAPSSQQ